MERILIDKQVLDCANMFETAFRALRHDVPGDLRALKGVLTTRNVDNCLAPDELAQYQGYLEEVATDYDDKYSTKHLLVLQPDEFDSYVKKYQKKFPKVEMDKDLVYKVQKGGKIQVLRKRRSSGN